MSRLRVMVHEAWDEVTLPWRGDATLGDLKRDALEAARVTEPADAFVLKYLGAELRDESVTVGGAALPDNAALIVLRRRRRPVR